MHDYQMNWTPDPSKIVFLDLETQSLANLKIVGGSAYLRHDSTRLLCLVAKFGLNILVWAPHGRYPGHSLRLSPGECWPSHRPRDGSSIELCDGEEVPFTLQRWLAAGYTFAAHNAIGFDAEGFDWLVSRRYGCGQPAAWYDTIPLCRANGLPGSLDELGKIFSGGGKTDGKDVLKLMYTAKLKAGGIVYPIGTVPGWKSLLQYNVQDVLILEEVFHHCGKVTEPDVLDAHTRINARGILYDPKYLDNLIYLWEEVEKLAYGKIAELTDGELTADNLRSQQKVTAWLNKRGLRIIGPNGKPTLKRDVLERFYEHPDEFFPDESEGYSPNYAFLCSVLKLRQSIMRVGKAKLERIKQLADSDNRVRNVLVYCGAHTGRWSGRGIQPHNFTRGVSGIDVEQLVEASRKGELTVGKLQSAAAGHSVDDVLSTLTRPVFVAPAGGVLAIADYAAIEGRGVAWVAEEECLLETFHQHKDVYCEMASKIYGREITKKDKDARNVGKVTVLGCGYSMSANKFAAYCKASRIDLIAAGTTPEACVESYRDAYPRIAGKLSGGFRRGGIWQRYARAASLIVSGERKRVSTGRCTFYMDRDDFCIELPSGRALRYRDASIQLRVPAYAALLGLAATPKPTIVYTHHHGYEGSLYGGLLTENIVQAICRDLLAAALVACRDVGILVVLHVHDEIVAESDRLTELVCLMSKPPEWAKDFPIKVEGFCNPVYTKSPFRGQPEAVAANGELL